MPLIPSSSSSSSSSIKTAAAEEEEEDKDARDDYAKRMDRLIIALDTTSRERGDSVAVLVREGRYLRAFVVDGVTGEGSVCEFYFTPDDTAVRFRLGSTTATTATTATITTTTRTLVGRRSLTNADRSERIRGGLRCAKVPVLRNRRRRFVFAESDSLDGFGPGSGMLGPPEEMSPGEILYLLIHRSTYCGPRSGAREAPKGYIAGLGRGAAGFVKERRRSGGSSRRRPSPPPAVTTTTTTTTISRASSRHRSLCRELGDGKEEGADEHDDDDDDDDEDDGTVPPVPDYRDRRVGVCPTAVVDPAVVRRPCRRRPSPPPPLLRGHRRGDSGQGRGLRRRVLPRCVGRPPRRLSPSSESLLTLDFDMGIPIASFLPFVKNLRWLCMCDPPWLKAPSMGLGTVPAVCVFDEDDLPSRPLSFPVGTGEV